MSDLLTPAQRHRNMAAIHSSDTKPEVTLRFALWKRGFRYRVNDHHLPGSPDIVLPKHHTVIFVHGCFWHGHEGCKYYTIPKTNTDFWTAKVARNKERDQETWRHLEAKGWSVIIVWECELKKAVLNATVSRVQAEILANGEAHQKVSEERRKSRRAYLQKRKMIRERESALRDEIRGKFK